MRMDIMKVVGALVVPAMVAATPFALNASKSAGECAEENCEHYRIDECEVKWNDCMPDQGQPCGEAQPGCAGKGKIMCWVQYGCEPEPETAYSDRWCYFSPWGENDGGGGDPNGGGNGGHR